MLTPCFLIHSTVGSFLRVTLTPGQVWTDHRELLALGNLNLGLLLVGRKNGRAIREQFKLTNEYSVRLRNFNNAILEYM